MNCFRMTDGKDRPPTGGNKQSRATDSAFDLWLNRGLHELFDDVVKEPVPPELLKLIQDNKTK